MDKNFQKKSKFFVLFCSPYRIIYYFCNVKRKQSETKIVKTLKNYNEMEEKTYKRTQQEWLELAREYADEIFDRQVRLFGEFTDTVYFCATTERFDDFCKLAVTVAPKTFENNNEKAKKVDRYINLISESFYMNRYTEDGELAAFAKETCAKMDRYAKNVNSIINY